MFRGEIWTVRDSSFASKSRPALIIQNDQIDIFNTIIVCYITTHPNKGAFNRVTIEPSQINGLLKTSFVMTDKIIGIKKDCLGKPIGALSDYDMSRVNDSLSLILALG